MKSYAKKSVQEMKAYTPPLEDRKRFSQNGGLLLDFNERTIPPSNAVIQAVRQTAETNLKDYPEYGDLLEKIAKYSGVNPNQVMITNGSDQGMDLIFRAFTFTNDKVIIPSPSFAMYSQCAQIAENQIISPEYNPDLSFPLDQVLDQIDKSTKLVVICNPNNPTGTLVELSDVEKVLSKALNNRALVYVDEAYFEFAKLSAVSLIDKYPNLIITRTFSKAFGFPALRIGYTISSKNNIDEMLKIRGPYDVNSLAVAAAYTALDDSSYVETYVEEVMNEAKPMLETYFEEKGIKFYPSSANFILFQPEDQKEMFQYLLDQGIRTRPRKGPNIDGSIRICIGTVEQTKKVIEVFEKRESLKIAFLDRDGALIYEPPPEETAPGEIPYQIDSIAKLKILPNVIEGLQKLIQSGYKLVMISNQDGIGTEIFPQESFEAPQNEMLKIFKKNGIEFDAIFICPHLPEENCNCRKPKTELVQDFLDQNNIDLQKSFMYGDRDSDRQFAENIGVRFIQAKTNGPFKPIN